MDLGENISEAKCAFSSHHIKGHIISTCLITGGVNFDHLVNVESDSLLQCKVPVFLFSCSIIWKQVAKVQ